MEKFLKIGYCYHLYFLREIQNFVAKRQNKFKITAMFFYENREFFFNPLSIAFLTALNILQEICTGECRCWLRYIILRKGNSLLPLNIPLNINGKKCQKI